MNYPFGYYPGPTTYPFTANARYIRARRAAKRQKRRYKRRTPMGRRAYQFGAAARRAFYKKLKADPEAWTQAQASKIPFSSIEGVGDYRFSKRVAPSWGARAGAWVGDRLGGWLGRITGLGDYEGAGSPMPSINPPVVANMSDRSVVISHREYIGDVVTSGTPGAFNLMSFQVNPGNPTVFPWLATLAPCFQEYKLNGCVFEFKSMSADALNSTNTALGQVICATNYNVAQPNYSSKFEMENTEFGSSSKPSCSFMHPIECDRRLNVMGNLYVAPGGAPPAGADPQFYNHCNFQIATNGFQGASVNIGELWVTYEIIMRKPIQPEAQGASGNLSLVLRGSTTGVAANDSIAVANLFRDSLVYTYPSDSWNPANPSGKEYYLTTSSLYATTPNTIALVNANAPVQDSSLVGRVFCIQVVSQVSAGATFTQAGSASGAPILSANAKQVTVPGGKVLPYALLVNGSGNSWDYCITVLVTGPGPVFFGWDPANQYKLATPTAVNSLTVTEIPAYAFGL